MSERLYKECGQCGAAVMNSATHCPKCGKKQRGLAHTFKKLSLSFAALFFVFVLFNTITRDRSASLGNEAQSAGSEFTAEAPADQTEFVSVIEKHRVLAAAAKNELAKRGFRKNRANALMLSDVPTSVQDWIASVEYIDAAGDKGVLSVEVGDDISLRTWGSLLSDGDENTLIEPSSQIYSTLINLGSGDRVRISGEFLPSETDYFKESSLTLEGSMQEPDFIFRFKSINPVKERK